MKKEEKVNSVEEAAFQIQEDLLFNGEVSNKRHESEIQMFIAGAEWQLKQYQDKLIEELDSEIKDMNLKIDAPDIYGAYRRCQEIIKSHQKQ